MTNVNSKPIQDLKSGKFYIFIILVWITCMAVLGISIRSAIISLDGAPLWNIILSGIILSIIALTMGVVWFLSARDFAMGITYFFTRKKVKKFYQEIKDFKLEFNDLNPEPKVLLVNVTYNDFSTVALERSMQQECYKNFEVIILDDSTKQEYRDLVDEFAKKHNITVVRRTERKHFKAGALNNFLQSRSDYDYFVVLDSDEILHPRYIFETLKYFYKFPNVGIVQSEHTHWNNRNRFMSVLTRSSQRVPGVSGNVLLFGGQNLYMGHGALISQQAFFDAGGFPNLVGEDSGLTMEVLLKGYDIYHDSNCLCEEEYPVDYLAFKKRQVKFTQADTEIKKLYVKKIKQAKHLKWFQKLDISTHFLRIPTAPIFGFIALFGMMGLQLLGCNTFGMIPMLVIFSVFLVSPLIYNLFYHMGKVNFFKLLFSLFCSMMLLGSLLVIMSITRIKMLLGEKAFFRVTPKKSTKFSFWYALKAARLELFLTIILILFSYYCYHSIIPVLLFVISMVGSVFLILMSNRNVENETLAQVEKAIQEHYITNS